MAYSTIALAALAAAQVAPEQQPLNLTCFGGGTANKYSVATVHSNAQMSGMVGSTPVSGSGFGNSTVTVPRTEGFSDQTDLRLFNGDDRIRLPRTILPLLHGGNDGWFKLKNVTADARTIRAEVAVNFINHPKVHIDRVTGTISISGKSGHYSGECEIIDAAAPAKF
jgi:hypothetical protein